MPSMDIALEESSSAWLSVPTLRSRNLNYHRVPRQGPDFRFVNTLKNAPNLYLHHPAPMYSVTSMMTEGKILSNKQNKKRAARLNPVDHENVGIFIVGAINCIYENSEHNECRRG